MLTPVFTPTPVCFKCTCISELLCLFSFVLSGVHVLFILGVFLRILVSNTVSLSDDVGVV